MIEAICPLCGISVLEQSAIAGYECSNCGEVFVKGKDVEWEVVSYEEWRAYISEKGVPKFGTSYQNTGGK